MMIPDQPLKVSGGAIYPDSENLRDMLTVSNPFYDEKDKNSEQYHYLYREVQGHLYVPRNLAPHVSNPDTDCRVSGQVIRPKNNFVPRTEEQRRVVLESCSLLDRGTNFIVCAEAGFGKTYIGSACISHVKRKSLILVTKQDLYSQWVEAVEKVTGITPQLWAADKTPDMDCPIVIGSISSVCKGWGRYPKVLYDSFGFVLIDECHRLGADLFSECMFWLPARLRLGLSATPKRKDGRDIVLRGHIGNILVTADSESMVPNVVMVGTKWKCPRKYDVEVKKMVKWEIPRGRPMLASKSLASCSSRNMLIADLAKKCIDADRKATCIFADTLDHLRQIEVALKLARIPASDIGYYIGLGSDVYIGNKKEKAAQRKRNANRKVILLTYKMASEGTNYPHWDTIILASPRADVLQIVGRIRRILEDKKTPLVFDLVDADSSTLYSMARKRKLWYMKIQRGSNTRLIRKGLTI